MNKVIKTSGWILFGFLSIGVSLYPLYYWLADGIVGLLNSKSAELLSDTIWNLGFYGHITFGGIALAVGWLQFSKRLRQRNIKLHRNLGLVYLIGVLIGGTCGIYIGFHATGGLITATGFILLGMIWLSSTISAYGAIIKNNILLHRNMMIISYAACFAAVTLRLWLPFLTITLGGFDAAYKIVAWLCWVPNMFVAFLIIRRNQASIRRNNLVIT
ncbi:MAG: DUF2306 domain-containing protein [Bacteroidota bacterium]